MKDNQRQPARNPRRLVLLILTVVLVALAGAQFVPVSRTNPPPGAAIDPPAEVRAILTRSCFDCHSNGTRWPWYSHVAPMSWLVADHVHDGRTNLNFSHWGDLSDEERGKAARNVVDQVTAGAMPIRSYLFIHRDARLAPADVQVLRDWFSRSAAESGRGTPSSARPWQDDALDR